jgi:hypothetical protein
VGEVEDFIAERDYTGAIAYLEVFHLVFFIIIVGYMLFL